MKPHGVEFSPYCIQKMLPTAKELCTEQDATAFLEGQPAQSYDYILATCLEYMADEDTLRKTLQHCSRVARHGLLIVTVQADVDDTVENHVVSLLKTFAWWEQELVDAGFEGLSKDEFVQYAPNKMRPIAEE